MTAEADYQLGDLSSLLGFKAEDSKSSLFHKSTPSAFSQKLEKIKAQNPEASVVEKKNKSKQKQSKETPRDNEIGNVDNNFESAAASKDVGRSDNEDVKNDSSKGASTVSGGEVPNSSNSAPTLSSPTLSPPPAVAAESKNARKRRKRKENVLMEAREAEAFDGEEPGKKKKLKKEEVESDEEEEEEKQTKKKKVPRDPAADDRTAFVGNLPTLTAKNQLLKLFAPYGKVENVRIRGAVSNDPKQSKKIAAISKNIHKKLDSVFAYVVFENAESVAKAVDKLNGAEFQERHLRVDFCKEGVSGTCNERLSIFVGNLPYDVSEEALRQLFHDSCGDVTRVRCVRDNKTRMGKGFGYVEFRSAGAIKDAVAKSETLTLAGRQLRIKRAALYGKNNAEGKNKFVGDSMSGKRMKKRRSNSLGGGGGGTPFKKGGNGPKKFSKGGKKNMVKL